MPKRLLIIDDDRAIAQLTAIRLRAAGYHVDTAFDGISGMALAAANRPDAILLDIRMPNLDGFEVNSRLKANASLADTPVIFLSANAQEAVRKQALAVGGATFLKKPYEVGVVIAAIELAVSRVASLSSHQGAMQ